MLVNCKKCKKKIDRDIAFKVTINNKNSYYCNEQEYKFIISETKNKNKAIDLSFEILGKTTNTALMKELKLIADIHSYGKIASYIESNLYEITKSMSKINSNNEYGKIRYYTAIIKNEISDFVPKVLENEYVNNVEFVRYKFKPNVKKSFNQFIDEY